MVAESDLIAPDLIDPQELIAEVDGTSVAMAIPLDPTDLPVTDTPKYDEDGPASADFDAAIDMDLPVRVVPPIAEGSDDSIELPAVADTTLPDWVTDHDGVSEVDPPAPFEPGAGDLSVDTTVGDHAPESFEPGPGDLAIDLPVVEQVARTSIEFPDGLPDMRRDSDGDGLTDLNEVISHRTDPHDSDSDDDGVSDGEEVRRGTNPLKNETDGSVDDEGGTAAAVFVNVTVTAAADAPIIAEEIEDPGVQENGIIIVGGTSPVIVDPGVQETGIIIVGGTSPEPDVAVFDDSPIAEVVQHQPVIWVDPLPEPLDDDHDPSFSVHHEVVGVADVAVSDHHLASHDFGFDFDGV